MAGFLPRRPPIPVGGRLGRLARALPARRRRRSRQLRARAQRGQQRPSARLLDRDCAGICRAARHDRSERGTGDRAHRTAVWEPGAAGVLDRVRAGERNAERARRGSPCHPQVVYTPRPGFAGTDTFTYSARDSSSAFPAHARAGVVTVTVPTRFEQRPAETADGVALPPPRPVPARARARHAVGCAADPRQEGQASPGLVPQARTRRAPLHLPHQAPQACVADTRHGRSSVWP